MLKGWVKFKNLNDVISYHARERVTPRQPQDAVVIGIPHVAVTRIGQVKPILNKLK